MSLFKASTNKLELIEVALLAGILVGCPWTLLFGAFHDMAVK